MTGIMTTQHLIRDRSKSTPGRAFKSVDRGRAAEVYPRMSNITTGTRATCRNRSVTVQKEWPSGQYTITTTKEHVEVHDWNVASTRLKGFGCSDNQIAGMAKDLGTYYMNE
jgi:hypothetical protein